MRARKLRVVANCPQPEPQPFRPIQYGAQRCPLKPKGTPITANPAPGELHAVMFSQSARTKTGARAEPWSYADSVAHLNKKARVCKYSVTVPSPLTPVHDHEQPAPTQAIGTGSPMPAVAGQAHDSPSRALAAAGSPPRIPQPASDDESGWDEYMRRAFSGEIEAF